MGTENTYTADFGVTPVNNAIFVIADANLSGLTFGEVWVMRDTHADNDVDAHEQLGSYSRFTCSISGTNMTVYAEVLIGFVTGNFKLRYVAN